jgi:hypothetical protein
VASTQLNALQVRNITSIVSGPTPPPDFTGISESEGNFIFSGTNGVPNWTYYVLTSTNLALPVSQWTAIATNTFDGNGYFNFTNAANSNGQQGFYLLQLQ